MTTNITAGLADIDDYDNQLQAIMGNWGTPGHSTALRLVRHLQDVPIQVSATAVSAATMRPQPPTRRPDLQQFSLRGR